MKTQGLKFKKFDLHVHTPASKCFTGKPITAAQIVKEALDKGITAIAITDHNTGKWIDDVKKAAEGTALTVFPGVEITVGDAHIHIIAILDTDKTTKDIEALLTTIKIAHRDFGEKEAFSHLSAVEVIEAIAGEYDGIAILAHIDSSNGVFKDMDGQPRISVIQHPALLAVEAINYVAVSKLLDGSDAQYKTKLAVYQTSDNPHLDQNGKPVADGKHDVSGIGFRHTYFKVDDKISLESLRQCFIDPAVRIRQSFEYAEKKYPYIKSVKANSGFLADVEFTFHRGLNSILGAKGVGKSLLIESMRFALNQESINPDILEDHVQKLTERLGQYGQVEINVYDVTGKEFSIRRTFNPEEGSGIQCIDIASGAELEVNLEQLFPALFLSQTEIIKIAENKDEQMKFIDKFFDFHNYRNKIANIERELTSLDKGFSESLKAYHGEAILSRQLKTSELELKRLSQQVKNPIFGEFEKLENKDKMFRIQIAYIETLIGHVTDFSRTVDVEEAPVMAKELLEDPALKRTCDFISKVSIFLKDKFVEQETKLKETVKQVKEEYGKWKPDFEKAKKSYQDVIVKTGGDAQKLETKRAQKVKEVEEVEKKLALVKTKAAQLKAIYSAREGKLKDLQEVYSNYFKARQEKCEYFEKLSNGKLQIGVIESTNKDEFKKSLASLKKGSYIRDSEVDQICEKISPRDFITELLRYDVARRDSDTAEKQKIGLRIKAISEKTNLPEDRVINLADHLLNTASYEELLVLQYKALPQDRPDIKYNIGDGATANYVPLKKLSTGQKCTAMIILALSEGDMPVIVDQPEDSLDIRAIWDDMCMKLRGEKEARQFIFTTHNSSVAVASDTDKFLIMTGTATKGELLFSGAIDTAAIREEVIIYLEGGSNPYKLKYLKYDMAKKLRNRRSRT